MAGLLTWSAVDHLPAETACTRIGSGSKIEHGWVVEQEWIAFATGLTSQLRG